MQIIKGHVNFRRIHYYNTQWWSLSLILFKSYDLRYKLSPFPIFVFIAVGLRAFLSALAFEFDKEMVLFNVVLSLKIFLGTFNAILISETFMIWLCTQIEFELLHRWLHRI